MEPIDRHKLHLFYNPNEPQIEFPKHQEFSKEIVELDYLCICFDYPEKLTKSQQKKCLGNWSKNLPNLKKLKGLQIAVQLEEGLFNSVCQLNNLKILKLHSSRMKSISGIEQLSELSRLEIDHFSQISDITPIVKLEKLQYLSIETCFKIENYESIGEKDQLIGLTISGDTFAPKNLKIKSLKPFENLGQLRHLDLSSTSIQEKESIISILELRSLLRFDTTSSIKPDLVDKILNEHESLVAGSFTDWDPRTKEIRKGKQW